MILKLVLLFIFISPAAAQYDMFTFNMSFLCGHTRQYTYDIQFNIRDSDPDRPVRNNAIGKVNGESNAGITEVSVTGYYDADASKTPIWEPIVEMRHNCVANPKMGYKTLQLQFAPSPALRNKTRFIYTFYMDITNKGGNFVMDAEITKVGPA